MGFIPYSAKARIIILWRSGLSQRSIRAKLIAEARGTYSKSGIQKVIWKYRKTGTLVDRRGSSKKPKMPLEHRDIIFHTMEGNNESTSVDLQRVLLEKTGINYHPRTIARVRRKLGWVATKAKYCQLVRLENCIKRLRYAMECLEVNEQFDDMIFTDESTIEIDSSAKLTFRRVGDFQTDTNDIELGLFKGQKLVAKPKHPGKLHVWAGISRRGATSILIFDGIMRKEFFVEEILQNTLQPFLISTYPDGHRFMQDNDPKHTSKLAQHFCEDNGILWSKTPAESPDMNPIEKVWHELKHYLRKYSKPTNLEELTNGIKEFWTTRLTAEKCQRYISNLRKVVPEVIRRGGRATGY